MTQYSGTSITPSSDAVTGKLCQAGANQASPNTANIIFWDGVCELNENVLGSAVGVVCPPNLNAEKISSVKQLAELYGVPAIKLDTSMKETEAPSKIAILDASEQRIYVNPDLETISKYFSSRRAQKSDEASILVCDACDASGCDGIVVDTKSLEATDEQEIYELLCDVADKNTGVKIAVRVSLGTDTDTLPYVRAVYRSGVWGRFSLLFSDALTLSDARRCVSLMHSAFRELDTEKREFNGFIPKGITVETPIMLLERPIHRLLDLFCLDLAALSVRFSGFEDTTVTELEKYVLAFIKNARDARISVSVSSEASLKLLGELCHKADIHEVYTTRHLISEVRKLL